MLIAGMLATAAAVGDMARTSWTSACNYEYVAQAQSAGDATQRTGA